SVLLEAMRPKICRMEVCSALRNIQATIKRIAPTLTSPATTLAVASGIKRLSCAPKSADKVARATQTQGTLTLVIRMKKDFQTPGFFSVIFVLTLLAIKNLPKQSRIDRSTR